MVKETRYENTREDFLLLAMITSTEVLSHVAPCWQRDFFKADYQNIIGAQCVDHFEQYGEAPNALIKNRIRCWGNDNGVENAKIENVEKVIGGIQDKFIHNQEVNVSYTLDILAKLQRSHKLRKLREGLDDYLDLGDFDKAEAKVLEYSSAITINDGETTEDVPLNNADLRHRIYDKSTSDLMVHFPGPLGSFFGKALRRDYFVSLIAPEGTGKSHWLMEFVYRGLLGRKRVAYFEVGDMSQAQVLERLNVRLEKKPEEPCTVKWPIEYQEVDNPIFEDIVFKQGISAEGFDNACKYLVNTYIKSNDPYLYLFTSPASTMSVAGIEARLQRLAKHRGWVPDIVVIDYADLLAPPKGVKGEQRDQIAETWKQLRALNTRLHCLLVTATQCNREGYDAKTGLRMRHVSEEKRKLSHVTHMVGINVTDQEKELGICRLNFLKARNMKFKPSRFVFCVSCLDLGQPVVFSLYPEKSPTLEQKRKKKQAISLDDD